MIRLTFPLEQFKSAPPEVRRWIEHEAAAAFGALNRPVPDPVHSHAPALAACTLQEAAQVYELIKGNFLLSQVFFEFARETAGCGGERPLHSLGLAELLRHTRLADGDRVVDCFTAINQAFRTVRNDPEASLFGFGQYGQIWIHQTTHNSIREVWEQLFHRQPLMAAEPAIAVTGPALAGFVPPHLGPSEDAAQHVPAQIDVNF